jgi:hypothetical protein
VFDGPVLQMLAKEPELRPASAGKAVEPLIAAARAIGIKLSESGIAPAFVQASVPPSPSVAGIARTTAGPLRGRRTPLWIAVPAVASALVVFAVVMSRGGREGASSASAPLASASPQVAAPPPFVTVSGEPAPETSPVQPSATDASARRDGGTSPAALPRDRRPRPPRTVHGALEDPF